MDDVHQSGWTNLLMGKEITIALCCLDVGHVGTVSKEQFSWWTRMAEEDRNHKPGSNTSLVIMSSVFLIRHNVISLSYQTLNHHIVSFSLLIWEQQIYFKDSAPVMVGGDFTVYYNFTCLASWFD